MNIIAVYSPHIISRSDRGFRHAIVPGEDRTLCGRDADNWFAEARGVVTFEKAKIGCKSCIRAHAKRSRKGSC